jgi:hypothetical protein
MARGFRSLRAAVVTSIAVALTAATAFAADTFQGAAHGVQYWKDTVMVGAPGDGNGFVQCPVGTKVSGGGFSQGGLSGELSDSFPGSNDGWAVNVKFDPSGSLDTWAICNKGARSFRNSRRTLGADKTQKLTVRCSGGKHVIGGGAKIVGPIADARMNSSYPFDSKDRGHKPDDGWRARGVNLSGDGLTFRAFVICAEKQPVYRSSKVTLQPSTSSAAIPACPDNRALLSGGVRLTGPGTEGVVHALRPSDGADADATPENRMLANGENLPGASEEKRLTGYAICG